MSTLEREAAEVQDRNEATAATARFLAAKRVFARLGVLPFLLIATVVTFSLLSDNFLTTRNLSNVARQSTYLVIVSMGQMVALIIAGLDLSVGTIVALTSVVTALVMAALNTAFPELVWMSVLGGVCAGMFAGAVMGMITGVGVALFKVPSFMMTLGLTSTGFGIALFLTSGMPVYGMPDSFGAVFGFGRLLTVPVPVYVTAILVLLMYILMSWTRFGRYLYAVGGNVKAARLSGVPTGRVQFLAHALCGLLAAISGVLLTARLGTGEANIGVSLPLESIAACVIGGVSLAGGMGRVGGVVLGALFIGLVQNGMNLARIDSYLQIVVIGILLILAVVADQIRNRIIAEIGK